MGCLFAIFAGLFPRLALFIVWLARPNLVDAAFDTWILPLVGIIFLPFATLMYVLLYTPRDRPDRLGVVLGRRGRAFRHRALGSDGKPAPHADERHLRAAPTACRPPSLASCACGF